MRRNLAEQAAELLAEAQVRADERKRAQVDVWHIDRIVDDAVEQDSETAWAISTPTLLLRLRSRRAEVRRKHDVGQRAEGQIVRRRFLLVDVERGARDVAALERLEQRRLLDESAAGAVDERTPGLQRAMVFALRIFFVSEVSGMWTVMKSARPSSALRSSASSTCRLRARLCTR